MICGDKHRHLLQTASCTSILLSGPLSMAPRRGRLAEKDCWIGEKADGGGASTGGAAEAAGAA